MPLVRLSAYRARLPLTSADGETGYRISLHWWVWVKCLFVCSILTAAGVWATIAAIREHPSAWGYIGIILAWPVLGHWLFLWPWQLSQTYILITSRSIYQRRVEDLVRVLNEETPMEKYVGTRYVSEGIGILGLRTVTIETEGNLPNIELKHAAGGSEIERAISHLRS